MLQAEEVGDRERIVMRAYLLLSVFVYSSFQKSFRGKMGGLVMVDGSLGTRHWTGECV